MVGGYRDGYLSVIRQLVGDCREVLKTLHSGSVQACITSPPYYGLRDYGLEPLVWGGDAGHTHEWGAALGLRTVAADMGSSALMHAHNKPAQVIDNGTACPCGAWRGSLGLEPTPELFIEHLVEVFRQVRRVLRDDGCLWVNLGDSYAGSGKGPTGHNGIGNQVVRQGFTGKPSDKHDVNGWRGGSRAIDPRANGVGGQPGYKAKDLMLMPQRCALALQANGWYLRSMLPWLKRNSMPESVTDRPANAVEYWFLFTKRARYFWDADAVRQTLHPRTVAVAGTIPAQRDDHGQKTNSVPGKHAQGNFGHGGNNSVFSNPAGRGFRNSDLFFQSWQGLLLDDEDAPLAMIVNPSGLKEAHFATFPPKLVEPLVKASTKPGDTVLDPFGGSGTVGLVADRLGRGAVLIDLKPDYNAMASNRLVNDAPLFVELQNE